MPSNIVEQLRRDEGTKLHAYQDHLGYWTIGTGRLIDIRRGGGITPEESDYLLFNDIDKRVVQLKQRIPFFNDLDDARKGVLINMAFQMGVEGLLSFHNTLRHISNGEYDKATLSMSHSIWAIQTPARCKRLQEQIRTGEWQ